MRTKKGFTLVELLMVIVIIGILAAIAMPAFKAIKEKSLDREAKASLALVQAAEKIYRMEVGFYYPASGATPTSTNVVADINRDLKLSLPTEISWSYTANASASNTTATRVPTASGRTWTLPIGSDTYTCSGSGCP